MAVNKFEVALARDRALDLEGALRAAPAPRLLPFDVTDYLKRNRGDHSLARLTFEHRELDELNAERSTLFERSFKLAELDQRLRTEQTKPSQSDQSKKRNAAELAECVERAADLRARGAALSARASSLEKRLDRCISRIRLAMRMGADPIRFVAPPAADKKLTLEAARERVLQLGADFKELEAAPYTAMEVKKQITQWVDGRLGTPHIGHLFDRGRENSGVFFAGREGREDREAGNASVPEWVPDAIGFALWLGRNEIIARLHAEADRLADDAHALSDEQLAKKSAKCKAELLDSERVEEALAWQNIQKGEPIVLRADADVRAILSIE